MLLKIYKLVEENVEDLPEGEEVEAGDSPNDDESRKTSLAESEESDVFEHLSALAVTTKTQIGRGQQQQHLMLLFILVDRHRTLFQCATVQEGGGGGGG